MYPVITNHFSELSVREYHRIVQAREAVFFLEQHITEPDADAADPQSVFMWMEDNARVGAFRRVIPAGIVYDEASVGRVLVDASYRRRGLCRSLMSEALRYIARTWGPQPIRISAQEHLAGFYATFGCTGLGHLFRSGYPARQNAPPVARKRTKNSGGERFPAPPEPYLY
ncbi:MAG: GNAT family N-acetyltransferase [Alistipes onderdonkii]